MAWWLFSAQDGGDALPAQEEEGADGNHRSEDPDGKEKAVGQISGNLFKGFLPECQNRTQTHQENRRAGDQAGGVFAPQTQDQHGGNIRQEGQGSGNGQDKGRAGAGPGVVLAGGLGAGPGVDLAGGLGAGPGTVRASGLGAGLEVCRSGRQGNLLPVQYISGKNRGNAHGQEDRTSFCQDLAGGDAGCACGDGRRPLDHQVIAESEPMAK